MSRTPRVVIGLGTGRCGTQSLAYLLSRQHGAEVPHEKHAWRIRWTGDEEEIDNFLDQLHRAAELRLVGDVAFYYLPYMEHILRRYPGVRFVCLKRDRDKTIASYMKKTDGRNHWVHHDGTRWRHDRWDHCYPKYACAEKEEAIGLYWDDYYRESERLQVLYPGQFRIFTTESLNSKRGQSEILSFVGIPRRRHCRRVPIHMNIELTFPRRRVSLLRRLKAAFRRKAA